MEPIAALSRRSASRSSARSERLGRGATRRRLLAVAGLLAISAWGCQSSSTTDGSTGSTPALGNTSLTYVYVALGDALTAGLVSNALVETHQAYSFPAQIARQAGTQTFVQPLVSTPGIDVELELRRLFPGPIVVAPRTGEKGRALNADLGGPFNNLGVPGATLADLRAKDGTAGGFYTLVLRGLGTALTQGVRLRPTLITLWPGNSDVLSAVVRGRAVDGVTLTRPEVFEAELELVVRALQTGTSATLLVGNIPDFTTSPFVTTIKPYLVDPASGAPKLRDGQRIPLIGPTGTPLPSSSLVTLAASSLLAEGIGVPKTDGGLGTPLPDEVVLDQNEVDIIRERVAAHNRSITRICTTAAVPVVDLNGFFARLVAGIPVGGSNVDATYLTGGAYSYDGVHLTDLGYALVTNEWIRAINAHGGSIPLINLALIAGARGEVAVLRASGRAEAFSFSSEAFAALKALYAERAAE
jgi:hypothetical protein